MSDELRPTATGWASEAAAIIRDWLREDGVTLGLGAAGRRDRAAAARVDGNRRRRRVEADVVVMATRRRRRAPSWPSRPAWASTTARSPSTRRCAPRATACSPPATSAWLRTWPPAGALRVEHWGDALCQGEIAGTTAAGAGCRLGDGPGLLVDDRDAHAQVRRVGRRLRRQRGWSAATTAPSPPGTARDGKHRRRPHP